MPRRRIYRRNRRRFVSARLRYRRVIPKGPLSHTGSKIMTTQFKPSFLPTIVPRSYYCKLNYCMRLVKTDSSIQSHQFRMNSIYDPDYTGIGSNALGWSEMNGLYQQYKVLGCKYRACFNNSLGTNQSYKCVIFPSMSTSIPSTTEIAGCLPKAHVGFGTNTGGDNQVKLSGYHTIRSVAGEPITDDNYSSLMGANPADVAYLTVITSNSPTGATSIIYDIKLTLYVKCFNPIVFSS